MLQGLGVDDNMSNLTSAISLEASISSSNNINEMANSAFNVYPQQNLHAFASPNNNNNINNNDNNNTSQAQPAPSKKRRNLPGHPDPEAEVVALSPRSLMATNRFVCEICNKGFQRDQNLQLHRRGHNLPWKLKQRNKAEAARKKVYVCPEVGCIHHEASRALGDLTGIKKHYSRKHGEKKWKCEKCSKRYAVHSDCKAHSKICGTREYRCDCGTLFSRRDSFITHRAFCDALAQESSKSMAQQNPLFLPIQTAPNASATTAQYSQQTHILNFNNFHPPLNLAHQLKQENHHGLINLPPWLSTDPARVESSIHQNLMNPNSNNNNNNISISTPFSSSSSLMSATALLQKAAQMGVTMSGNKAVAHQPPPSDWNLMHHVGAQGFCASATSSAGGAAGCLLPSREANGNNMGMGESEHVFGNKGGGNVTQACMQPQIHNVDLASTSLPSTSDGGGFDGSGLGFEDGFEEILNSNKRDLSGFREHAVRLMMGSGKEGGGGGGVASGGAAASGLTRDFLGLRTFPDDRDFLNMAALDEMGSGQYDHHHQIRQNQGPWQS